jgi:hypothetical protein
VQAQIELVIEYVISFESSSKLKEAVKLFSLVLHFLFLDLEYAIGRATTASMAFMGA